MKILASIVLAICSVFGLGLSALGGFYSLFSLKVWSSEDAYFIKNLGASFHMLVGAAFAFCLTLVILRQLSVNRMIQANIRIKLTQFVVAVIGFYLIGVGGYLAITKLYLPSFSAPQMQVATSLFNLSIGHFIVGVISLGICLWSRQNIVD